MTKNDFNIFNNKISNHHTETILFKEIKNTLVNSKPRVYPPFQIEKLVNAYQLKRQEQIMEFNPFLNDNIKNVLKREYLVFSLHYKSILKNLSFTNNEFSLLFSSPINLWNTIFPVDIVFNTFIITYIHFISDTAKFLLAKEANFLHLLVTNFLNYFDYKLKNEQAKLYLIHYAQIHKKNLSEFKRDVVIFFKNQKYDSENWEFYILFIIKFNSKNVFQTLNTREKSELYLFEKTKFINFWKKKRNLFFKFFYKFGFLINEFFLNNKLLIKIKVKKRKNIYDYEHKFNLKIFNKIDSILHLNCDLLPIIKQSAKNEWDAKGQNGGYLYNNMSLDRNLAKKLKSGFSTFNYSLYTIFAMNALQGIPFIFTFQKFLYNKPEKNFKKDATIKNIEELYCLWTQCIKLYIFFNRKYSYIKFNYAIYKHELFSLKCKKEYKNKSKLDKLLILKKINAKYQITENFIKKFNNYFNKYKFFFKSLLDYKKWAIILHSHKSWGYDVGILARLTYCGRICQFENFIPSQLNPIYLPMIQESYSSFFTYDKITFDNLKVYIIALLYKNTTLNFTFNFYLNLFRQYIEKKELFFTKKDYNLLISYVIKFQNKTLKIKKKLTNYWNLIKNLILQMTLIKRNLFINALLDYFKIKTHFLYKSELLVTINQDYSSFHIYSLLSMDKKIANLTNLFSKKKKDLYLDFLHKFKNALKVHSQDTSNENKLSLINNFDLYFTRFFFSRLIVKSTFYKKGNNMIINIIKTLDKKLIYKHLRKQLFQIIKNLILVHYTKIDSYQNTLIAINKILHKNNCEIKFKTLDDSIITYKHFDPAHTYNKIWSKKSNRYISYKSYSSKNLMNENKISIKNVETFIQNFVYTIEGALSRIILLIFLKLYKSLGPYAYLLYLYKTYRVPLVFYPHLLHIIKYVYIYIFLNNYFHKYKVGIKKYEYFDHPLIDNNETILKSSAKSECKLRYMYQVELDSENYLDYMFYFGCLHTDLKHPLNVLNYCFLDHLNISDKNDLNEISVLIESLQKQIEETLFDQKNEKEIKKILSEIIANNFMVFF